MRQGQSTIESSDAVQPLASKLQELGAEEHRLVTEIKQHENNLQILAGARKEIRAGDYTNRELPILYELWKDATSMSEKVAAIEPEIAKTTAELEEAKRQLAAVKARLADTTSQSARLAQKEAGPALQAWSDAPVEVQQGRVLAAEQKKLKTEIEDQEQRGNFWRGARVCANGDRGTAIESPLYSRLTFGCFTDQERVQKVDREIADADAKVAESRKRYEANERELERLRRVLMPRVRKELQARAGKLDELMKQAEEISLGMDAVSAAVVEIGLLGPVAAGSYLFFRGDSFGPSTFREERLRKLQTGVLEVKQ